MAIWAVMNTLAFSIAIPTLRIRMSTKKYVPITGASKATDDCRIPLRKGIFVPTVCRHTHYQVNL